MGALSPLASMLADFCCLCSVESPLSNGNAWDTGTLELRQRAGLAHQALFCFAVALRKWGALLPWALLRPGSRVWGMNLWSLQTDYNSAPGHYFQSSVSKGGLVPEPQATGERGRQASRASGTSSCLRSGGQHSAGARTRGRLWK